MFPLTCEKVVSTYCLLPGIDSGTISGIYSGAVGPGFLWVQVTAWRHVARVCRQFLDHRATFGIDSGTYRRDRWSSFS